jgi:hypothetical protein
VTRELLHADVAIGIGKDCGALLTLNFPVARNCPCFPATVDDVERFNSWETAFANLKNVSAPTDVNAPNASALALPLLHTTSPTALATVNATIHTWLLCLHMNMVSV